VLLATAQKKAVPKRYVSKSPAKRTCALWRNNHCGDASSFVFREEDMISFVFREEDMISFVFREEDMISFVFGQGNRALSIRWKF